MSCLHACVPVNLQTCVFSLCSCEYVCLLSACVCVCVRACVHACLVACFVITGSAYMYNNLLYCTRFDSFVCTDVWCSSQTRFNRLSMCDDFFFYQSWCNV